MEMVIDLRIQMRETSSFVMDAVDRFKLQDQVVGPEVLTNIKI